jgi:hypothetical protein
MELQNFGCIKSVAFPSGWHADSELNTGVLKMLCVRPEPNSDIEITLFQKTQGVSAAAIQDFRAALNQGEHKIVEGSNQLLKLSPVMGNAGNNQWTNKERGRNGPNFRFTSGEVVKIKGKPVLKIKGSFLEPESKQLQNEYCGIFIDAGTDNNLVQEIYLQVPSHHGYFQFEKHLKTFTDALSSLSWV